MASIILFAPLFASADADAGPRARRSEPQTGQTPAAQTPAVVAPPGVAPTISPADFDRLLLQTFVKACGDLSSGASLQTRLDASGWTPVQLPDSHFIVALSQSAMKEGMMFGSGRADFPSPGYWETALVGRKLILQTLIDGQNVNCAIYYEGASRPLDIALVRGLAQNRYGRNVAGKSYVWTPGWFPQSAVTTVLYLDNGASGMGRGIRGPTQNTVVLSNAERAGR